GRQDGCKHQGDRHQFHQPLELSNPDLQRVKHCWLHESHLRLTRGDNDSRFAAAAIKSLAAPSIARAGVTPKLQELYSVRATAAGCGSGAGPPPVQGDRRCCRGPSTGPDGSRSTDSTPPPCGAARWAPLPPARGGCTC